MHYTLRSMTYDEFDTFCDGLPATHRVIQWGGAHVWKVGDRVFAIGGWSKADKNVGGRDDDGQADVQPAFVFKTSDLSFQILRDQPGLRPAPYLASRGMKWIQRCDSTSMTDDDLRRICASPIQSLLAA
jgi:predicted DNA-binding protein (MmcQ/YjbR family)